MKYAILILAGMLCLSACRKEKTVLQTMEDQSIGSLTATMNGEPWQASFTRLANRSANGRVSIVAHVYIDGIEAQQLYFQTLNLAIGKQAVSTFAHYPDIGNSASKDTCYAALSTLDGDIAYDDYFGMTDGTTDDHLYIDSYNPGTGDLRGSFQLDLVRYRNDRPSQTPLPDTLRFRNGRFNLKIPKG